MALYEILHAIEHQPYEWWQKATEHPRLGLMWRKLYGFHHMHHANITVQRGHLRIPRAADRRLGVPALITSRKELLLSGRVATAKDFAVPPPWPFVRSLDAWARKRETHIRTRDMA